MADPSDRDELLTVEHVCAWFNVTRDWIYDEVEAGRLPYIRLGRRSLRFRRTELDHYLASRTQRPSPQPRPRSGSASGALESLD